MSNCNHIKWDLYEIECNCCPVELNVYFCDINTTYFFCGVSFALLKLNLGDDIVKVVIDWSKLQSTSALQPTLLFSALQQHILCLQVNISLDTFNLTKVDKNWM